MCLAIVWHSLHSNQTIEYMDRIKLKRYLTNPLRIFLKPWLILAPYIKNDELFLRGRYLFQMGKPLHLNPPRTFNEKLQWLTLYDRNPKYTVMVDKYAVKEYVANTIGKQYVIPLLAVWDNVDDIDTTSLPDKFVLKTTNGGGGSSVFICKCKKEFRLENTKQQLLSSSVGAKGNFYVRAREWPYKDVKYRIIAEQYLETTGDLCDYKVHVFNGEPKLILVCQNRYNESGLTEDFFDEKWNRLKLRRPSHPNSGLPVPRPDCLPELLDVSRKLSKGIPFVRVDFYIVNNHIYFGELTFYPATGMHKFIPESWDVKMGEWLNLNHK